MLAGARTHVDHVVGGHDRIVIVLDHDHGIAEIPQPPERVEQTAVVALVQSDGGLVQHVHHAGQTGADLAREPDALRFAARERVGGAVEREVVESDVDEELQPVRDLAHDLFRYRLPPTVEGQLFEELLRILQGQRAHLVDGPVGDPHVARFRPEPRAVARRAGLRVQVLRELFLQRDGVGLPVAPLQVRDDAFEGMLARELLAALAQVGEAHLLLARAVEHHLLRGRWQLLEGRLQVEAVVTRERLQHLKIEMVAPVPAFDRARSERQVRKGDDALGVEKGDGTEAVALGAGAHRIVEREEPRFQFGQRIAADRARELRGEKVLAAGVHFHREGTAIGMAERGLEALREPLPRVFPRLEPIHHHLDGVFLVLRELRWRVDVVHLAVDTQPDETLGAQLVEEILLLALAPHHERRQDHDPGVLRQREHVVHHLRHRLHGERDAVLRTVRLADAGEEKPQVVVDFGYRSDRGTGVVAGRLLLDRDGRGQPLDQIHVGLFHELQELPGVGGEALDIAPLALGVERVEGE